MGFNWGFQLPSYLWGWCLKSSKPVKFTAIKQHLSVKRLSPCLLSSLSPPDCLVLLVFKDKSDKAQGNKERASITLEEICGLEAGQWYEGVAFTLVVLCLNQSVLLGFDSREALQAWDARLRYSLGEGEQNLLVLFTRGASLSGWSTKLESCLTSLCCSLSNSQQPDEFIHHAGSFQYLKFTAVKEKWPIICQTCEHCRGKFCIFCRERDAKFTSPKREQVTVTAVQPQHSLYKNICKWSLKWATLLVEVMPRGSSGKRRRRVSTRCS